MSFSVTTESTKAVALIGSFIAGSLVGLNCTGQKMDAKERVGYVAALSIAVATSTALALSSLEFFNEKEWGSKGPGLAFGVWVVEFELCLPIILGLANKAKLAAKEAGVEKVSG